MSALHASSALTPRGWGRDVRIEMVGGLIASIEIGAPCRPGDQRVGALIPALPNLHSHAFQRGMAGLAERRGPGADSFWSWRDVMYRHALALTPDQVEAIAAQLYVEMLEAGFGRVGEFHYLHHAPDGLPYADPGEMAASIAAAAETAGIALTLLPVFYAHGGFGGVAPSEGQRRFVSDLDLFCRIVDRCRALARPGDTVGVAPHSLRAVAPGDLSLISALAEGGPVHIHVAEQMREVEECLAWSGQRPVEWLLDHVPVDERWCLIHATHMTPAESAAMARSGAVAGLCPITEANLGDGIFDAPAFVGHGGRFGVGSDSNVQIGAAEELRQLEYSQRLATRSRNVLAVPGGSTGRALFEAALAGGTAALGAPAAAIQPGASADLVGLFTLDPSLAGRQDDALLDAWIFSAGSRAVRDVWVGGDHVVVNGRHRARENIALRFSRVMNELANL